MTNKHLSITCIKRDDNTDIIIERVLPDGTSLYSATHSLSSNDFNSIICRFVARQTSESARYLMADILLWSDRFDYNSFFDQVADINDRLEENEQADFIAEFIRVFYDELEQRYIF